MSLSEELTAEFEDLPGVVGFNIEQVQYHGEKATQVKVTFALENEFYGSLTGIFTTQDKASFGGVQFSSRKNIAALMASKVRSVLAGTSDS